MSLINQMLQDLEKRQPGVLTSTPPPAWVAVPVTSRRTLSVWWAAVPVFVIAIGIYAWLVGVPSSRVAAPKQEATPIRIIQPAVAPVPIDPPAESAVAQVTSPVAPVAIAVPVETSLPVKAPPPVPSNQPTVVASVPAPEPAMLVADPAPVSAPENKPKPKPQARPDKPLPTTASSGESQVSAVPTVTKEMKEITPQQQAENAYRKAVLSAQQGRTKESMESLHSALQLDARHAAARQMLVGLLLEVRRYGDAERLLQEGLAINPEQPNLVMILARLQVERGDIRGGLANLERALPYATDNADYQAFLAALLQREGRHRQAIEHYLLALRHAPQTGVWLMGLGISLQAENRLAEAREAFARARASSSLSPELLAFVEQRSKQLGQ